MVEYPGTRVRFRLGRFDGDVKLRRGPNAAFTVRSDTGTAVTYEVTDRVTVDKGDYPRDWFRLDGPRRLALFTCAGLVDGQFTQTTATFARPVTST